MAARRNTGKKAASSSRAAKKPPASLPVATIRVDEVETALPLALHVATHHQPWRPEGQEPSDGILHICRFVAVSDLADTPQEFDAPMAALGFKPVEGAGEGKAFQVARVTIREVVGHVHAPTGWFDSFDQIDSHMCELGEWLHGAEDRLELPAMAPCQWAGTGAAFYVEELCVHPAAQGGKIGLHLLGHALTYLNRSESDLAVLKPIGIPNKLDPSIDYAAAAEAFEPPEVTPGLIPYYAKAGFAVDEGWLEETGGTLMWAAFGALQMPKEFWPKSG